MQFDSTTRYQILLQITNAVVTRTTSEELFKALATELRKHIPYDRLSINLYEHESKSLSYFATADGIAPEGIACKTRRPLSNGSITKMVIESGKPVIIEDLTRYRSLSSVGSMVDAGLKATVAFPLVIRSRLPDLLKIWPNLKRFYTIYPGRWPFRLTICLLTLG